MTDCCPDQLFRMRAKGQASDLAGPSCYAVNADFQVIVKFR